MSEPIAAPCFEIITASVDQLSGPLGAGFWAIYEQAFDPSERLERQVILDSLASGARDVLLAVRDQQVIALATLVPLLAGRACLLEYLAVERSLRSQGIGGAFVVQLACRYAQGGDRLGMAIECEHPDHAATPEGRETRLSRLRFYERNGAAVVERLPVYWTPDLSSDDGRLAMKLLWYPAAQERLMPDDMLRAAIQDIYRTSYEIDADRATALLALTWPD